MTKFRLDTLVSGANIVDGSWLVHIKSHINFISETFPSEVQMSTVEKYYPQMLIFCKLKIFWCNHKILNKSNSMISSYRLL